MARRKSVGDSERKMGDEVRYWITEIEAARKRESDYRSEGKKIRDQYAGERKEATPFNVLYANTDIMLPSLYSQTPRPVVERRFKDNDVIGLSAARAGQRVLEFLIDTNIDGYETFHEGMKNVTLDGLLPGRGISGVKYDAEINGEDVKTSELVCTETRSWDRVYFGYARKWSKVPWIAFEEYIDKEEAERLFGEKVANDIEYTVGDDDADKDKDQNQGERKTAKVYQIWDKDGGRKVRWISPHYPEAYLKVADDPLELTGFFNIPRPLMFVEKTDDMIPTPLYALYENQAQELNSLTVRISRIIRALKARGAYDAALGDDIGKIMDADDNELVPTDKGNSLAADRGLGNAIWFMPLEVLQQTLQQLYVAREQCKQVIYEIMGISDIVRGASKASETLGAQQLKSQWGTLRLKNKQAEVQRYARDMLRMMLEVAATKFSQDTWAKMTGLPFLTDMQVQQMQVQLQGMQQQATQAQQMAVRTGQQLPPETVQQMQQQMQQLQQQLQTPKWSDVLTMLQDDMQRSYRIDIETNSTIEPEAAEDQKNIAELMNAMSQFLNGVGPMVQQGILPFQVARGMLLAITRRFRFGNEIEDDIKAMQPPKPEDDGEKAKAAKELQQAAQGKAAAEGKVQETETKLTATQEQLKLVQREAALADRENKLALEKIQLDYERDVFKIEQKVAHESVVKNATMANKELDHKRQLAGAEAKNIDAQKNVSKTVDSKMAESVKALQAVVETLVTSTPANMLSQLNNVAQVVAAQTEQVQELAKAVRAPKRKRAIRDPKTDRIIETVEETVQ